MKKIILPLLAAFLIIGLLHSNWDKIFKSDRLTLSGTLELTEHSVGARAPGRLDLVKFEEGGRVQKGELIATLDRFDQTSRDLERTRALFKSGGATRQTLELAELAYEDQSILSPVDGVVLVKVRESGEVLAAGSPVAVIGDDQRMWVKVFVPEGVVNRVRIGQPATLKLDGISERLKGHVSFVAPKAEFTPRNIQTAEERITQTFAVKVTLDDNGFRARPGVAADVRLDLKDAAA